MNKLTAEDLRALQANLGLVAYAKLGIPRRRFAEEGSTEGAPAVDQAGSGAQSPNVDQDKTTGPKE